MSSSPVASVNARGLEEVAAEGGPEQPAGEATSARRAPRAAPAARPPARAPTPDGAAGPRYGSGTGRRERAAPRPRAGLCGERPQVERARGPRRARSEPPRAAGRPRCSRRQQEPRAARAPDEVEAAVARGFARRPTADDARTRSVQAVTASGCAPGWRSWSVPPPAGCAPPVRRSPPPRRGHDLVERPVGALRQHVGAERLHHAERRLVVVDRDGVTASIASSTSARSLSGITGRAGPLRRRTEASLLIATTSRSASARDASSRRRWPACSTSKQPFVMATRSPPRESAHRPGRRRRG
jgi:hypothetical protein